MSSFSGVPQMSPGSTVSSGEVVAAAASPPLSSPVVGPDGRGYSGSPSDLYYEGWLIKSPPLEQTGMMQTPFIKARWRRRWFVLQPGTLKGQYVLNYFTDETQKKLKGSISLDDCEQVDVGLTVENGKQRYDHMFDIRTPQRTYYLAADSDDEMNAWARMVCTACGFKPDHADEEDEIEADAGFSATELNAPAPRTVAVTSNVTSASTLTSLQTQGSLGHENPAISSPYIHISTCHSGNKPAPYQLREQQRKSENSVPQNQNFESQRAKSSANETTRLELSNYEIGDDSVFFHETPPKTPKTPKSEASVDQVQVRLQQTSLNNNNLNIPIPPGRPPKPPHLAAGNNNNLNQPPQTKRPENYANSNEMQSFYQREFGNNNLDSPRSPTVPFHDQVDGGQFQGQGQNGPAVPRSLKPGRSRMADKSATVDPKRMGHGKGHESQGHPGVTNQGFATMAHPQSARNGGLSAPPVPRALKPKNAAKSEMDLSRATRPNNLSHPPPGMQNPPGRRLPPSSITLPRHFHSTATEFSSEEDDENESYSTDGVGSANGGNGRRRRHSFDQNQFHPQNQRFLNHNTCNIPAPPTPGFDDEEEQIYFYMPSFESQGNSKCPMMIPAGRFEEGSVAYIDLDLPPPSSGIMDSPNPRFGSGFPMSNAEMSGRRPSTNSGLSVADSNPTTQPTRKLTL